MNITKITIDSVYGIQHCELDGKPVELIGAKGTGKTSVIDAIRLALTNKSPRQYIIKDGESESQIFIQTDTGIDIERKKRLDSSDVTKVKEFGKAVNSPQGFLDDIFTPLQLNPVEFATWDIKTQNRMILDLVHFDWDMDWIRKQFGEIPPNIDYGQHILSVLHEIQKKYGYYYTLRHDANKEELYKRQSAEDIASTIPMNYDVEFWSNYDLAAQYQKLNKMKSDNSKIERAKDFIINYNNKVRGLEADRDIKISAEEMAIQTERISLEKTIERLQGEIATATEKLNALQERLNHKKETAENEFLIEKNKLASSLEVAEEYSGKEIVSVQELENELVEVAKMKEYISEFQLMKRMIEECEELKALSKMYDEKIEKARMLPGEILQNCDLPVDGLSIVNGIPLIHGLPIDNLSDGEKIDFCVDVALSQETKLKMILLNGVESLDEKSRTKIYDKCKAKGVQVIAARTTNDSELTIIEL